MKRKGKILAIILFGLLLQGCMYAKFNKDSAWMIGQGTYKDGDKEVECRIFPDLNLLKIGADQ